MKSITEFITEQLIKGHTKDQNNSISQNFRKEYMSGKPIKATGDETTWWYYQSLFDKKTKETKDNFCKLEHPTDEEFIDAFSKNWYPGEGDNKGSYAFRYVAHYMAANLGLKTVQVFNAGRYTYGEQHFKIFYLPLDSKARNCKDYVVAPENTCYSTSGGFHGNDTDIHFIDDNIKTRKDVAKIVLKLIKSIKV